MFSLYSPKDLLKLFGLVGLYVLLARLTALLFAGTRVVDYLWLASGVAFGILLKGGNKYLPAIFLGALLGCLQSGGAASYSLAVSLSHALGVFLGIRLLKRDGRFDPRLSKFGDSLRVLILALGIGLFESTVRQALALLGAASAADIHGFQQNWTGHALGVVIVMPLLLVWQELPRGWAAPPKAREAALILGLSFLVGQVVFLDWLHDSLGQIARGYWMYLFIVWAAVRLGAHGTVLVLAMTAVQAIAGAQLGTGFFADDLARTHLANYFFYMLVLSVVGISLTTHFSERRQAEAALRDSEARFRSLTEMSSDWYWEQDEKYRFTYMSSGFREHIDIEDSVLGKTRWELPHFDTDPQLVREHDAALAARKPFNDIVIKRLGRDNVIHHVQVSGEPVFDESGRFKGYRGVGKDITEQKKAEQQLRIAATAFESQEGIMITDADNVILRVNRAFTEISGYPAEEAVGQTPRLLKSGRHDAAFYRSIWESLGSKGSWQGEIWNRRKNGEVFPEWLMINSVRGDDGAVTHYVATMTDITLRKAAENRVGFLASHDRLTELPNRELFYDRLSQAVSQSRRKRQRLAVLFLDLDGFKAINDTYGHEVGDFTLQTVSRRLQTCVRTMDTIARLGGDEFAVILNEIPDAAAPGIVSEKIINKVSETMTLNDASQCSVGISIGIAIYPEDGAEIDSLLKAADSAMYESKLRSRNSYTFAKDHAGDSADRSWITLVESHLVGVKKIDEEHQEIAFLLNRLNLAINRLESTETVAPMLEEVVASTKSHFQTEEKLMEQYAYPGEDAHKIEHQRLVNEVTYLKGRFSQGGELLVLQWLKDWFLAHIAGTDKLLADYLIQRGIS